MFPSLCLCHVERVLSNVSFESLKIAGFCPSLLWQLSLLPLFFGSSDEPLFGAYEAPRGSPCGAAVLLLNPAGWEYLRAHRSLRVLSARLADNGFDVFRFDYTGTGDSWGDEQNASLTRWLTDAVAAAEELDALAGGVPLHIVGLRHGARLAQLLVAEQHLRASSVVLWDPPRLDELAKDRGAPKANDDGTPPALRIPVEVAGAMAQRRWAPLPESFHSVVVTSIQASPPDDLVASMSVQLSAIGADACWVEQAHHGAGPISLPAIETIIELLSR